ncbi:MAG: alpha/beta hydrolase [Hyphomicrobiaceae bacterium]|nr:alpha/beta hydrolase [Hyphomicrobiaceae bacterium]
MIIGSLALIATVLAAVVLLGAPLLERALLYAPEPTYSTPASAGLAGFAEDVVVTPDGERLVTWAAPGAVGMPTLIYFHGNAGTLAERAERLASYRVAGLGVRIMAYRGYSGSTGKPTERANVADAIHVTDVVARSGVALADIVLYGESIGSGVAVQVAAARPVGALVLDAPYTSIVDVAERYYPYLPARLLMRDRYETMLHLKRVSAPTLVIHGERDMVIPVEMGRRVAEAAPGPGRIVTFREAGHTDHYRYGSFEAVIGWLRGLGRWEWPIRAGERAGAIVRVVSGRG